MMKSLYCKSFLYTASSLVELGGKNFQPAAVAGFPQYDFPFADADNGGVGLAAILFVAHGLVQLVAVPLKVQLSVFNLAGLVVVVFVVVVMRVGV